jgi:hypothetical protein
MIKTERNAVARLEIPFEKNSGIFVMQKTFAFGEKSLLIGCYAETPEEAKAQIQNFVSSIVAAVTGDSAPIDSDGPYDDPSCSSFGR